VSQARYLDATFYNWKAKYAGMTVAELGGFGSSRAENAKLKRIVADLALDNAALKDLLAESGKPAVQARGGGILTAERAMA